MKHSSMLMALLCLFLTNYSQAQTRYTGTIIDQATAEPLVGATITAGAKTITITNYNGQFDFAEIAIRDSFKISYLGFESLVLPADQLTGWISLKSSAIQINQVVVSANRDAKERVEEPIAISVLSPQLLQDTRATRLEEVLNKVSGVYMVDLGNEQHTMAIRQPINYKGLFLYLEDGLPIRPTGVFNHNALLEMNMANLRRIEVVRGPSSSLYGSEAIGGAINFITLRPAAIPTGRFALQGNNNAYRRADLNVSNTFGKVGLGLSAYYAERRNGFRDHSDFDKLAITLRADYLIDDKNTLSFSASYIDYYADMTGSLDSAFFFSQNYTSQQKFTNRAVDALRTKLSYNRYWSTDSKTSITIFARDNAIRQNPSYRIKDDYSPWNNPTGDRNLAFGELNENKVRSYGFVAQHKQKVDWWKGLTFMLGASMDNSPNSFVANFIRINKSNENIYTDFVKTDSVLTDYEVALLNFGTYANLAINLTSKLQLTAALRYDKLDFSFKNNLDENAFSGAPDGLDDFAALTPKLGLTYQLAEGRGFYANYSQGFLPPQISELYRGVKIPALEPAQFDNFELGAWFQWRQQLSFDVSLYQMEGKNEIISVRLDDGTRENRNAGQTQHRGIEYTLTWTPHRDWQFRFSGTNAQHRFIEYVENGEDYSGGEMGQAPAWIANSELTYQPAFLKGFRTALEWQHVDEYFLDNANTASYPGYDIFNLRLSYTYRGFEFWTNLMNLTNKLYATTASRSRWGDRYSVGEPRAFNLGIAYNFQQKK